MAKKKKCAEIELPRGYAMIELPLHSVEATITAKVWMDGEVQEVQKTMSMAEIQAAFKESEWIYIPQDAVFQLTETGKKYLEDHRAEMEALWNE